MRVAVIYHILPHYREAVFKQLDASPSIQFTFASGNESYRGIGHLDVNRLKRFRHAPFRTYGSVMWQAGAIQMALSKPKFDALIFLSDLHFASTWIAAIVCRLRGVPVLFWGHGWLRHESKWKSRLRRLFYRLSDHLLVYGERGAKIGAESGFPGSRITVVYNSLDLKTADILIGRIESQELSTFHPRELFSNKANPLIVCTARLTKQCKFGLLLEAAAILRESGIVVNTLLVGDGPERMALETHATRLGLPVVFFGKCHDEKKIAQILYHADLTVSPGKVGLTAVHSLMYGTPVITHGDFDEQMPEVETIESGTTGLFFERGNTESLALCIAEWLATARNREQTRAACRGIIKTKWNPDTQAKIIERTIFEVCTARN